MARERLIPHPPETERRGLERRFREFASKVLQVPKDVIDQREAEWLERKKGQPKPGRRRPKAG